MKGRDQTPPTENNPTTTAFGIQEEKTQKGLLLGLAHIFSSSSAPFLLRVCQSLSHYKPLPNTQGVHFLLRLLPPSKLFPGVCAHARVMR